MNRQELLSSLIKQFPYAYFGLSDDEYASMTEASYLKTGKYLKWIMRLFGIFNWTKKFQCDDFALVWAGMNNLRHAKGQGSAKEGVLSGIVWYKKDGELPHAVNIIYGENGWRGLEPQTNEIFEFTQEERESVWLVLM